MRIDPKSKVIVNAVYDFLVLGHADPKYAKKGPKTEFWPKMQGDAGPKIPLSIPLLGGLYW